MTFTPFHMLTNISSIKQTALCCRVAVSKQVLFPFAAVSCLPNTAMIIYCVNLKKAGAVTC